MFTTSKTLFIICFLKVQFYSRHKLSAFFWEGHFLEMNVCYSWYFSDFFFASFHALSFLTSLGSQLIGNKCANTKDERLELIIILKNPRIQQQHCAPVFSISLRTVYHMRIVFFNNDNNNDINNDNNKMIMIMIITKKQTWRLKIVISAYMVKQ